MIKWIGQHIVDLVARFRGDVYLDDIETGTVVGDKYLGLDHTGKIVKSTVSGGSGSGNELTDSEILVTNTAAGFEHISSPISADTNYTEVLRTILNPYNLSSISLSSVKLWKANTSGVYSDFTISGGSNTIEVGQKWKIDQISYTIGTASQLQASSVKFRVKLPGDTSYTELQTGLASSNQSNLVIDVGTPDYYEITDVAVGNVSSGDRYQFDVSAIDEDGGSNVVIEDKSDQVITVKDRVRFGAYAASTTDVIADNAEATTLFTNLVTAVDALSSKSNDTATQVFNANASMANASNYTWIIYPQSWGALARIDLQPGTNVLGAFTSSTHTVTNSYGQTVDYYFYRSRITGAYSTDPQDQLQLIF
tara:strand:- start:781 stop:1875 length:1095 start_codon:yes stop_codon:yes gene_type:complete